MWVGTQQGDEYSKGQECYVRTMEQEQEQE